MKGRRHTPEQVVRKLREADRLLAEGSDVDAVCRHLEISIQTYQRTARTFTFVRARKFVRTRKGCQGGRRPAPPSLGAALAEIAAVSPSPHSATGESVSVFG